MCERPDGGGGAGPAGGPARDLPAVHGFRPFPAGDTLVTNDVIDDLRDRDGESRHLVVID